MERGPLSDYKTQIRTLDGHVYTVRETPEQIERLIEAADSESAGEPAKLTLSVRGPLRPEGWQSREWLVPLWAIAAIGERP